jgi:hypothetical protein
VIGYCMEGKEIFACVVGTGQSVCVCVCVCVSTAVAACVAVCPTRCILLLHASVSVCSPLLCMYILVIRDSMRLTGRVPRL